MPPINSEPENPHQDHRTIDEPLLPSPFIVAMLRSGTTLLRLMLDAHPEMAIPPETHFLRDLVKLPPEEVTSRDVFFSHITECLAWNDFHLSPDEFSARLDRITPFNPTEGLRCFYRMYAEKFDKKRWGDKSTPYGWHMGAIHRLLPEAHFIHVIRDGRDAALSHRNTYFWRDRTLVRHATQWRERIVSFREQVGSFPYIEIHYEKLLRDTTVELKRICEFLQLEYTPEMERYYVTAPSRMDELSDLPTYEFMDLKKEQRLEIFKLTSKPPDASRIERWRQEMALEEILAYQAVAGDLLKALGYPLVASPSVAKAPRPGPSSTTPSPAIIGARSPAVKSVSLTWVRVPFRARAARHMTRELPHWKYFEICELELDSGVIGFGETMPFYTWGRVTSESIRRVLGRSAREMMWDDSVGPGLQQALFDAVGKAYDLPIHRLLGPKYRDRVPLGWWAIDMPGEDWAAECQDAIKQGYTLLKTKARPWFDLKQQCLVLEDSLPPDFAVRLDFNSSLLDSERALPYLLGVEQFPQVDIFEEPIPVDNVEGYRRLRKSLGNPIALHSGEISISEAVENDICDGFVLSRGGAGGILEQAWDAASRDKPFWLQQVGTGITAAFSLHCAAVSTHAKWAGTTCHQVFEHSMIRSDIAMQDGTAAVPDAPGLGVELDRDALERFSIEPLEKRPPPVPGQLIAIRWPTGKTSYYAHAKQYWEEFLDGRFPIFEEGVYLESIEDDGSAQWTELQERAAQGGVHLEHRPF